MIIRKEATIQHASLLFMADLHANMIGLNGGSILAKARQSSQFFLKAFANERHERKY